MTMRNANAIAVIVGMMVIAVGLLFGCSELPTEDTQPGHEVVFDGDPFDGTTLDALALGKGNCKKFTPADCAAQYGGSEVCYLVEPFQCPGRNCTCNCIEIYPGCAQQTGG